MAGSIEINKVLSGGISKGTLKRAELVVGVAVVVVPVPTTREWAYVKVVNRTANTTVTVAIDEDPTNNAADPPSVSQWGIGYDINGGSQELIPLRGPVTAIRIWSTTAATDVVLNLISA